MDTSKKIVPSAEAVKLLRPDQHDQWVVVAGLFDPVTAKEATRLHLLAGDGQKLLAVVLDECETLLTAKARARLVCCFGLRLCRRHFHA